MPDRPMKIGEFADVVGVRSTRLRPNPNPGTRLKALSTFVHDEWSLESCAGRHDSDWG